MPFRVRVLPAVVLTVVALAAACRTERLPELSAAELRPTTAGGTTAGYFVLENEGRDTVRVDSIVVSVAGVTELHETTIDSAGVARMRPVEMLVVPPDSTVRLRPGGLHLMVLDVRRELRAGERVPMTVWINGGRSLTTTAAVRQASAAR